ncbi:hypothetical protein ABIA39_005583 [Nocardia sp. GAS34]
MSLDDIAAVFAGSQTSTDWRTPVRNRVSAIEQAVEQLHIAKHYLEHMLGCPRDNPVDDCPKLRAEIREHGEIGLRSRGLRQ